MRPKRRWRRPRGWPLLEIYAQQRQYGYRTVSTTMTATTMTGHHHHHQAGSFREATEAPAARRRRARLKTQRGVRTRLSARVGSTCNHRNIAVQQSPHSVNHPYKLPHPAFQDRTTRLPKKQMATHHPCSPLIVRHPHLPFFTSCTTRNGARQAHCQIVRHMLSAGWLGR